MQTEMAEALILIAAVFAAIFMWVVYLIFALLVLAVAFMFLFPPKKEEETDD